MSIYFLLYLIVICRFIFIWSFILKKYKNKLFWKFLFLSIMSYSLWLIIYILVFTTIYDKNLLLYMSRFMYGLSFLAMYSMFFFVLSFENRLNNKYNNFYIKIIIVLLLFISSISFFSPYIIKDMLYDETLKIYYEDFWIAYNIYTILFLWFVPLLTILSYFKIPKLVKINKIRLKYILYWYFFLVINEVIFLALLPIFWIRIFQKEQVLFFIPFIISMFYVSYRYKFIDFKLIIWRGINFLLSLISAYFVLFVLEYYLLTYSSNTVISFWGISANFWFSDLFLGTVLYLFFYSIFKKYLFWNNEYIELTKKIWKIKKKISFSSDFNSLNDFLSKEFATLIKAKFVNIKLNNNLNNLEWLSLYFFKDKSYNFFINDTVFIEENKHKFDWEKIIKEISEKAYLVFPLINNKGEFLGICEIWIKFMKDMYTSEEIDLFLDFVDFLVLQLKHIEIYEKMQDININLDKKVDEKTIEYNNLLNKQADFISMISHEIKSPLGSSIFQVDSIIDDITSWIQDKAYLLEELEILNKQLLNVGDLTKTMFSIKKFDLDKVELFRQKVDINLFLDEKIQNYKKENKDFEFILDIKNNFNYINIDKIQFWQVIDNLLVNAIKFADKENPKIYIKLELDENNIIIDIEDNWKWFSWIDAKNIFDKYVTGNISDVWIGIWMYLCKKIVELHGWTINAQNWTSLSWAAFIIRIPNIID